jgi:solute carrier family 35, member E1
MKTILPSPPSLASGKDKAHAKGAFSSFASFLSSIATHNPTPASRGSASASFTSGIFATFLVFVWILVYYLTSTASTVWNKQLVDSGGVSVTVLTLLHLLVSLGSDLAIIQYGDDGRPQPPKYKHASNLHKGWDILVSFAPISIFLILSKLTTYVSYKHVSVSLSHTAKASEPIFNVLVAAVLFGEYHAKPVYYSLLPIAVGVTLASATDFSFNFIGFFWSVVSALMKVLQNIYTKRIISSGRFSFFELHGWCGAASLAVLLPIMIIQGATASKNLFSSFPIVALMSCSLLQYISSISSYKVLHLVR